MRIGLIVENIGKHGGVARVNSIIANAFSTSGHDVTILTYQKINRDVLVYPLDAKISVQVMQHGKIKGANRLLKVGWFECFRGLLLNGLFPESSIRELDSIIKNNNIDCMIASHAWCSILLSHTQNKCTKIGWQHNETKSNFTAYRYNAHLKNELLEAIKKLDQYVTINNYDKVVLTEYYGITADKITVIPNPLSIPIGKHHDEIHYKIIAGGILTYHKGIDLLLSAMVIVQKKFPEITCIVFGDGQEKSKLLRLTKKNHLANIDFIGYVENVAALLNRCDLFVLPSRTEGFGLVATEAMSQGVPVISFDTNGPKDIIEPSVNGMIIHRSGNQQNDIIQLAHAIIEFYSNRSKIMCLSENSINRARLYEPEKIIKKWLDLFQECRALNERK